VRRFPGRAARLSPTADPKESMLRRLSLLVAVLATVVALSVGVADAGLTPNGQFTVSPNPAEVGDQLTVTSVTTCELPGEVSLSITDPDGNEVVGETVATEADGSWQFQITIPPFAAPGEHTVSATCDLPVNTGVEEVPPFVYDDVTLFINEAAGPVEPTPPPAAQPAAVAAVVPAFTA
jgi:hypothetical protein